MRSSRLCSGSNSRVTEEVRSSRRELMARVTDGWTEEERESFAALLTRFNLSLSELMGAASEGGPNS